MKWFKAPHDTFTHQDLAIVAARSGLPVGSVVGMWHVLMSYASKAEDRGSVKGIQPIGLAVTLGYDVSATEKAWSAMESAGIIVDGRMGCWKETQGEGKTDAERVSEWRKRKEDKGNTPKSNVTVTDSNGAVAECNDFPSLSKSSSISPKQEKKNTEKQILDAGFERWFPHYWSKANPDDARKAFPKAVRSVAKDQGISLDAAVDKLIEYAERDKVRFSDPERWQYRLSMCSHNWLRGEKWHDPDPVSAPRKGVSSGYSYGKPTQITAPKLGLPEFMNDPAIREKIRREQEAQRLADEAWMASCDPGVKTA